MRRIRQSEGFTLIELMIVVAIIGILAAIAIPNFLKFQCRSRQSEAKTNLAGIFTAEKAFFGEYTTYGTDLTSVNWGPDGAPVYVYGFKTADSLTASSIPGLPGYTAANKDTQVAAVVGSAPPRYSTLKMKDLLAGTMLTGASLASSTAATQSFTAAAAGDVDTDTAQKLDKWSINEFKTLGYFDAASNDCAT